MHLVDDLAFEAAPASPASVQGSAADRRPPMDRAAPRAGIATPGRAESLFAAEAETIQHRLPGSSDGCREVTFCVGDHLDRLGLGLFNDQLDPLPARDPDTKTDSPIRDLCPDRIFPPAFGRTGDCLACDWFCIGALVVSAPGASRGMAFGRDPRRSTPSDYAAARGNHRVTTALPRG